MASKKARVLVDFKHEGKEIKANEVVAFEDADLKAYKAAGQVDDSAAAVEYAEKAAAKAKASAAADEG